MSGRGSRAEKAAEVPGPGVYDPKDAEFDAYKHGAFLEKQDRFGKPKLSEVPGPGSYDTNTKTDGRTKARVPSTSDSRYAALQRKLEDLEKVHEESKKAHQADVERLKLELARLQRMSTESNERAEKLKKRSDVQDARMQVLKKSELADQTEIKDLKMKLRLVEHERTQLASKQGEAGEAKKAVHALETKRKEEVRERERKISELERALTVEKRKRENVEARLAERQGKADLEAQEAHAATRTMRDELMEARCETERVKAALAALRSRTEDGEEELVAQLDNYRAMLSRVAQEYGRLVSSTVSMTAHERVKRECLVLQLRVNRLERKNANMEGQVVELANFVRHTQEQSALLTEQLCAAEEQLAYYTKALASSYSQDAPPAPDETKLARSVHSVGREFIRAQVALRDFEQVDNKLWRDLDKLRRQHLFFHSTCLVKHVDKAQQATTQLDQELSLGNRRVADLSNELSTLRAESETTKTQLFEAIALLATARTTEESLKKEVGTAQREKNAEVTKVQKLVKQEREATQRLAGLVQQGKATEEALNAELDRLTMDLTEAEQYREAYFNMIDEVEVLVRRNALAEDEAHKLSKFNAQILSHNNPQQRILYVDKIRQELHETKQKLLIVNKEKEAVINENDELQHELEMYKSVGVPTEVKPRTFLTRVTRAPLASQNLNAVTGSNARSTARVHSKGARRTEYKDGDMTLDELDV